MLHRRTLIKHMNNDRQVGCDLEES